MVYLVIVVVNNNYPGCNGDIVDQQRVTTVSPQSDHGTSANKKTLHSRGVKFYIFIVFLPIRFSCKNIWISNHLDCYTELTCVFCTLSPGHSHQCHGLSTPPHFHLRTGGAARYSK